MGTIWRECLLQRARPALHCHSRPFVVPRLLDWASPRFWRAPSYHDFCCLHGQGHQAKGIYCLPTCWGCPGQGHGTAREMDRSTRPACSCRSPARSPIDNRRLRRKRHTPKEGQEEGMGAQVLNTRAAVLTEPASASPADASDNIKESGHSSRPPDTTSDNALRPDDGWKTRRDLPPL